MPSPLTSPGASGPAALTRVRTPQPGEDSRLNWLNIGQIARAVANQALAIQSLSSQLNSAIASLKRLDTLYPFKLYQLPSVLRATPDPANDWRKFRVRAGRVIVSAVTGINVSGTDGYNDDPDSESYPSGSDITVPDDNPGYWFWIEIATGGSVTATVKYGDVPSTNGWAAFPNMDGAHIPIGVIDTQTNTATKVPLIRQLLRSDVFGIGCPIS